MTNELEEEAGQVDPEKDAGGQVKSLDNATCLVDSVGLGCNHPVHGRSLSSGFFSVL